MVTVGFQRQNEEQQIMKTHAKTALDFRFGTPDFVIGHRPANVTGVCDPIRLNSAVVGSDPLILHIVNGESDPGYAFPPVLSPAPAY
jgi:hypothetical protein